jgi:hypothetical protein
MRTGRDHILTGVFALLPIIAALALSVVGCLSQMTGGAK